MGIIRLLPSLHPQLALAFMISFPHMASAFFEAGFVLRKAMPGYRLVGWLVGCSFHWEKAAIWDTVGGLLEGDQRLSQTGLSLKSSPSASGHRSLQLHLHRYTGEE